MAICLRCANGETSSMKLETTIKLYNIKTMFYCMKVFIINDNEKSAKPFILNII